MVDWRTNRNTKSFWQQDSPLPVRPTAAPRAGSTASCTLKLVLACRVTSSKI
jgi:hypothetical protein